MRSAIIAAVVSALVSAASGVAATKYVLSSTHQIAPPVLAQLAKLKAKTTVVAGPAGPAGSSIVGVEGRQGATGLAGQNATGEQGPAGPPGERGERGLKGAVGESIPLQESLMEVESTSTPLAPGEVRKEDLAADCPSGFFAISGGYEVNGDPAIRVFSSRANTPNIGWRVEAVNESSVVEGTVTVTAECAQ
jgi:hypothetical protein